MHQVTFVFKLQSLGALQVSWIDKVLEKKVNKFCWIKQEIKCAMYKKQKVYEDNWSEVSKAVFCFVAIQGCLFPGGK